MLRTVRRTKTGPRRDVITVVDQPPWHRRPPIVPAAVAGRADRARDGRARIREVKLPAYSPRINSATWSEVVKIFDSSHDCSPGGYEIAAEPRNDRGAQLARP